MTDDEIMREFDIPGLNIEASLEPRELELFLIGCRSIERQALERAANLCNGKSDEYHAAFKRAPVDDPRRGNPYVEGMSDGCSNCADAIRALQDAQSGEDQNSNPSSVAKSEG